MSAIPSGGAGTTETNQNVQAIKDITSNTVTLLKELGVQNTQVMQTVVDSVIAAVTAGTALGVVGAVVGLVAGLALALTQQSPDEMATLIGKLQNLIQQFEQGAGAAALNQRIADIKAQVGVAEGIATELPSLKNELHTLTPAHITNILGMISQAISVLTPPDVSGGEGLGGLWAFALNYQIPWDDSDSPDLTTIPASAPVHFPYGHAKQAPSADVNGNVFNYTHVLPAYVYAVSVFLAVGTLIDPDFKQNWSDTVLRPTAHLLQSVHDYILNNGITLLSPGEVTSHTLSDWFSSISGQYSADHEFFAQPAPGVIPVIDESVVSLGIRIKGISIEYGAVEKFSGNSSVGFYTVLPDLLNAAPPDFVYNAKFLYNGKFQIRLRKRQKDVYVGAGLLSLWNAISNLKSLAGDAPLQGPIPADWSFRKDIVPFLSIPQPDGSVHLRDTMNLFLNTPAADVPESLIPYSFRNVLLLGV